MLQLRVACRDTRREIAREVKVASSDTHKATLADLKHAFSVAYPRYTVDRQRWYFGTTPLLEDAKLLSEVGVTNETTLYFKDLGPQVSWRTVFLVEYLGPLLIYPFFYYVYYASVAYNQTQRILFKCLMAKFIKRDFHYWILGGLFIAYESFAQNALPERSGAVNLAITALFIFAELSNLSTHMTLRNLRPRTSTTRAVPKGYGFDYVSCPNYTFEILAWVAVAMLSRTWSSIVFLIFSSVQMYLWARKKHQRYRREFPDYPRNRTAIVPFLF